MLTVISFYSSRILVVGGWGGGAVSYRRNLNGLVSRSLFLALGNFLFVEHSSYTKTQARLNLIPPVQHGAEAALLDADPLLPNREAHAARGDQLT